MPDVGIVKSLIQTIPVRSVDREPAKKEQRKKKKGKVLPQQEKDASEKHVNEYI